MTDTSAKRIPSTVERSDLLRSFTAWTQNSAVAEDLTQQTLIEAWKSARQPGDDEWRPWLFGIARNVFYRWRRDLARDLRRSIAMPESDTVFETPATLDDLDDLLDRQEMMHLLAEMLETLPVETRRILLLKYLHELPQAAIADELGLHEKAVEGRLHRSKRKLRDQLLTLRPDTALSLGIISEENVWQHTPYWCQHCGHHRLMARWTDDGELRFACPSCQGGIQAEVYAGGTFQSRIANRRPTFASVMSYFNAQTDACVHASCDSPAICPVCGSSLQRHLQRQHDELVFEAEFSCESCAARLHFDNLLECGVDTKAGIAFRERNPRVAAMPPAITSNGGMDLIQARWIALDAPAEFIAWHDPDSGHLLAITSQG